MTSLDIYYFLYKTTNLVNGKIYVGKHKTKNLNDGYIGSGKLLKRAINKYGIENFKFEILQMCSSEEELNALEKEMVTEEFCLRDDNYNLCVGGLGGFSYINREGLQSVDNCIANLKIASARNKILFETDDKWRIELQNRARKAQKLASQAKTGQPGGFKGKKHSQETIDRIKQTKVNLHTGVKNSQFGTMWITNGSINRKILKTDQIPNGWSKGRIIKNSF